jgi:hypothetical protein
MTYLGLDWEAGHDPAPPAWKASTLPAYAHSELVVVRAARLRTCTSFEKARPLLRRLRLPISPRPDVSDELEPSARFLFARANRDQVSALAFAELRRLGAGGRIRTCNAPG